MGRPKLYANMAARQRAYRARLRAKLSAFSRLPELHGEDGICLYCGAAVYVPADFPLGKVFTLDDEHTADCPITLKKL